MKRAALILALLTAAPTGAAAQGFGLPGDALASSLGAGWRQQQNEARDAVRRGQHVPLPQVLETLRRRTPGRILDSGIEEHGGRKMYRVRWAAADGRRIDYLVDAETGAVVRATGS
ncbi:MAG TPA: PepSY domain-containing protein [Caulobacteraceae bacterium]|jgi:uncharacterized membrane protein YkoI